MQEKLLEKKNILESIELIGSVCERFRELAEFNITDYYEFEKAITEILTSITATFLLQASLEEQDELTEEFFEEFLLSLKNTFADENYKHTIGVIMEELPSLYQKAYEDKFVKWLNKNEIDTANSFVLVSTNSQCRQWLTIYLTGVIQKKYADILVSVIYSVVLSRINKKTTIDELIISEEYSKATREVLEKKFIDEDFFFKICLPELNSDRLSFEETMFFIYYTIGNADVLGNNRKTRKYVCDNMELNRLEYELYYRRIINGNFVRKI